MSVTKRPVNGKITWVADFSVTLNGKRMYRKRKVCSSKKEAQFYENAFLEEYNAKSINNKTRAAETTIKENYIEFASTVYDNKDTRKGVLSKYNNYLDGFYKDAKLDYINKNSMAKLRVYISELKDKKGLDISDKLKETIWQKNKTFINWLKVTDRIEAKDYFIGLKRFCDLHKTHKKQTWDIEEFMKFINVVEDPVEKLYFFGLFTLGTRKSELNNLRFSDIDELSRTFTVQMQYKDKSHGETKLKTDESVRTLPLSQVFLDMANNIKDDLIGKGVTNVEDLHVFINAKGNVLPRETVRRHFKEYIQKAGIVDIRLHDLRGSFATRMISETGNIELVRLLMGHSDARTTMAYITPNKRDYDKVRELNEIAIDYKNE